MWPKKRLLMRCANRIQQPDERDAIFLAQPLQRLFVSARHDLIDLGQQRESFCGNPAQMLPPIPGAALATDELFGFEAIEQPGHARGLFDHAIRDLERRQPGVARTAQDAEDVELLQRDAVRLDEGRGLPADQVRGPHQADHGFVRGRLEGPSLAKLVLQGRGHGRYIMRQ